MKLKSLLMVLLALAAAAAGFWGGREMERRDGAEAAKLASDQHRLDLAELGRQAELWADAVAGGQGEAVLRSFVAGVAPSLLAERRDSLEISAVSLLRIAGVEGIHILRTDGIVLYSSDVKLSTTGEAGEGGAWALAASELVSRPGARPGTVEFAVPVVDGGAVLAVVWMEYGRTAVRDAVRPRPFTDAAANQVAPDAGK